MEYVRVVDTLPFSIGEVWGVISGFGALRTWMDAAESCALEGEGIGAVRTVKAMGGLTRERLLVCDPMNYKLAYVLEEPNILPAKGVQSEMSLRSLAKDQTELTWVSKAESFSAPAEELANFIRPFFEGSIASLERALRRAFPTVKRVISHAEPPGAV